MNTSPIESIDEYTRDVTGAIYGFGPDSFGVWLFVVLAVLLFVGFIVRVIRHENQAYAAVIAHTAIEPGPPVEAEPSPAAS